MSIINQIPHSAKFLPCYAVIPATFNAPGSPGVYTIDDTPVALMPMRANAIYLFDAISFAASIPSEVYTASLLPAVPLLTVSTQWNPNVLGRSYPLPIFKESGAFTAWVNTDIAGVEQKLRAAISGQLAQTAETVGTDTINLIVTFDVYEMTDTEFQRAFRDVLSPDVGQQIRGAL